MVQSINRKIEEQMNHKGHRDKLKSLCSPKDFPLKDITEKIITSAIEVHSALGPGLLESAYEEALAYEFELSRINFERQKEIRLKYKGKDMGIHRIDFLVEGEVILELKATEQINKIYEAQVLTYLKAMKKRVGLLINFNIARLREGLKRLII